MTKQQIKQEITRLSRFWYKWVVNDHHKDCDCHWYINKVWSYGNKPEYRVCHYGYVFEPKEQEIICNSFQKAHKVLYNLLVEAINKEKEWGKQVLDNKKEYDRIQIKQAKIITDFNLIT